MKNLNQNFTSNNLNKKKSGNLFIKSLICEHLTLSLISFEIIMGSWRTSKYKMFTRKELFSVDSFTRKSNLFFDETFRYINDKPCVSKQKLSNLKKKEAPCFFKRFNIGYLNHTSHLKGTSADI